MKEIIMVHVICWDGVEYNRESSKHEIDKLRKGGYVKEKGYHGITFDFYNNQKNRYEI